MVILSLDVSTVSTGWCVFVDGGIKDRGTIKIKDSIDTHNRMVILRDRVAELITKYCPSVVIVEDVWFGKNPKTAKLLAKFCGVVEELSTRTIKKPPVIIENTKVKKFFKCATKLLLFQFMTSLLDMQDKENSFSTENDSIDATAQLLYYLDSCGYSIIRIEKDYGFLYDIKELL